MKQFLLMVLLLGTSGTLFSQKTIAMIVNEKPESCQRMMPQTCLNVKIDGAKEWSLFYDRIYGFEYEAGYRYELLVIQTERPEPVPQDLSKYTYKLDKVVSKTLVPVDQTVSKWKLVRLNGEAAPIDNLIFGVDEKSGTFTGFTGCNNYNAGISYNKRKSKATLQVMNSVVVEGTKEATMTEAKVMEGLSKGTFKLKIKGDLWIWSYKRKEIFAFQATQDAIPTAQPNLPDNPKPIRNAMEAFNGKELKVIQVNGNTTSDTKAVLTFDLKNNRFFGSNGCNQINGTFRTKMNQISFSDVVSTKMACLDEKTQQLEREIMDILNAKGHTMDFAERVMNIYNAEGKLVLMLAIMN